MSNRADNQKLRSMLRISAIILAAAFAFVPSSHANTLRRGSSPAASGGGGLDTFFSGYFDFGTGGTGDNIIRIENPTSLNGNMCAMIYIFDTREEMGECCGCLLTPNQLRHDSLKHVIGKSWTLAPGAPTQGVIQIVSALPNVVPTTPFSTDSQCAPSDQYNPTPTLDGWITHAQTVAGISGLTEVSLTDNGDADPAELTHLITLCGLIIGNGSGAGICTCPISDE